MFEILSLELDGSKYLKKRKRHLLTEKVREILDYYQAKNQIAGYKMIIGETDLGRNEIIGIELQYYITKKCVFVEKRLKNQVNKGIINPV